MPPLAVITETLDDPCVQWLQQFVEVVFDRGAATRLADADALVVRTYTQVDKSFLTGAGRLKVVGRAGVGLDNIDLQACHERGISVVYTPDANTQAVVEYVLGLILDDLRPRQVLGGPVDAETFHQMRKDLVGGQINEKVIGILGFGRIGKRLGRVLQALGAQLLVNDLLPATQLRAEVDYPFEFVEKDRLYSACDILTVHVDGRPSNRHLIDDEGLASLKADCLLINASRGFVIANEALSAWARRVDPMGGRAVLDVHDPEPIPADYSLLNLPNVKLLPHLASRTTTGMRNMSWVVKDVVRVLEGKAPQWEATKRRIDEAT